MNLQSPIALLDHGNHRTHQTRPVQNQTPQLGLTGQDPRRATNPLRQVQNQGHPEVPGRQNPDPDPVVGQAVLDLDPVALVPGQVVRNPVHRAQSPDRRVQSHDRKALSLRVLKVDLVRVVEVLKAGSRDLGQEVRHQDRRVQKPDRT